MALRDDFSTAFDLGSPVLCVAAPSSSLTDLEDMILKAPRSEGGALHQTPLKAALRL